MTYPRVAIDLNVRVRRKLTYVDFDDSDQPLSWNKVVTVYEPESGLEGIGRVVSVDKTKQIAYIEVDWSSLKDTSNE